LIVLAKKLIAPVMRRSAARRIGTLQGPIREHTCRAMSRTDWLIYAIAIAITLAAATTGAVHTWPG